MGRTIRRVPVMVACLVAVLGLSGAGAALLATTAGGAQTYPPGTNTITIVNGETIQASFGQTLSFQMGGFPAFSDCSIYDATIAALLGSFGLSSSSGYCSGTVLATDPHISINGGPAVAVPSGANTLTVSAGGVTQSFALAVPATTTTTTAATGTSSSSGSTTSGTSGASLAFTGADIAATVVGGIALLAIGIVLVVATRRRATTPRARS